MAFLTALMLAGSLTFHDGPEPIAAWVFHPRHLQGSTLKARLGPDASFEGAPKAVRDAAGQSLMLDGEKDRFLIAPNYAPHKDLLPKRNLTVEAWVAVNSSQRYGGVLGVFQDNGGAEKGWVLGYNDRTFTLGLASTGADDGDGKMTYLPAQTQYEYGRLYHVVGTYNGEEMRIYVNGKLEGSSKAQSGDILYPSEAPWSLAAYRDGDENFPHHGRIVEVSLYDIVATEEGAKHLFEHRKDLAEAQPYLVENPNMEMVVEPYLQFPSQTEMTVMWETSRNSSSTVYFGPSKTQMTPVKAEPSTIHRVTLKGLKPSAHYLYRVESIDSEGRKVESEVLTFRTAPLAETPIRFCVVGDTQDQPQVNHQIAKLMWDERPDFFMIPGDLVGTGQNKKHWTSDFFGSMRPLLSRVPLLPVLGNHENDARLYYDYMAVPEPEYYYRFPYGPAEFFVIDSGRNVNPGSEQYKWLENALASSKAKWKFVAHHYPPFSSDEDDYGNLWEGQSTRGDLRIRQLAKLYEKYGVDVVWTGHIHSYERTWPLRAGKQSQGGPIYVVCGGGGGGLETHGPTRPDFSHSVRHGHHYCVVSLSADTLDFRAFDIQGRLFDTMQVRKGESAKAGN
jgi:predicted phosphodiesterase